MNLDEAIRYRSALRESIDKVQKRCLMAFVLTGRNDRYAPGDFDTFLQTLMGQWKELERLNINIAVANCGRLHVATEHPPTEFIQQLKTLRAKRTFWKSVQKKFDEVATLSLLAADLTTVTTACSAAQCNSYIDALDTKIAKLNGTLNRLNRQTDLPEFS